MKNAKIKQILLLTGLVLLILLLVLGSQYLKKNPMFGEDDERNRASATYRPYQPAEETAASTGGGSATKIPESTSAAPAETPAPIRSAAAIIAAVPPAQSSAAAVVVPVGGISTGSSSSAGAKQTTQEPIARFYTTKRATVFTFSGLGNLAEVTAVLEVLRKTGSTATFFVTEEELDTRSEVVRLIRNGGHSLGISIAPNQYTTTDTMAEALVRISNRLRTEYGFSGQVFVRPTYGSSPALLLKAAEACGMQVMTQLKEGVPESISRANNVTEALNIVVKPNDGAFQRGEVVHFQMGLIQHNDYLLSQLVENLIVLECPYPVMSADAVAADVAKLYIYPVPDSAILPEVKDKIYPGHLVGYTNEQILDVISAGYIGIDWVDSRRFLPGFESGEIRRLNKKGLIPNDMNYVFLTFDDWGTDPNVDKLLEVLRRHNAKATFFVRTEYVKYNPNLLRAIAADGHTIGDHTHKHNPLSNEVTATQYAELTAEQLSMLPGDLVASYETLQSIIGDMRDVYGRPSLSTLFRPPTLAVSKSGLTTVFDCGFTHSISGYYSTGDYKAESAEKLAGQIKRHIKSGAVIVMHFSDTAIYTADALDICLSELEAEGKGYIFAGLNAVY